MISSNHKIELYINGELVELGDDGLGIKLNNTINTPTKLTASTTTYSYSFKIPLTAKNAKLLGDINVLSKRNKFNKRYDAILYADSVELFNGNMKVSSVEKGEAKCNLYVSKLNTIDSIFGNTTMNSIDWKVDFNGVETINQVNADSTTKYFFPFVAYNLFNKRPNEVSESGYEAYTDKKTIDDTCRFYFNSFIPSMNMVETMKKCFQTKGLELTGDIVNNDLLNEIYLSQSIGTEDDPLYNYGNPAIGTAELDLHFQNYWGANVNNISLWSTGNSFTYDFKEENNELVYAKLNDDNTYDAAIVYNLMDREGMGDYASTFSSINIKRNNGNMVVNGGIQIPTDGYYQIECDFEFGVPFAYNELDSANKGTKDMNQSSHYIHISGSTQLPVEFQLLKFNTLDSDMNSLEHAPMYYGHFPNESRKIQAKGVDCNGMSYDFYRYSSAKSNGNSDVKTNGNKTIAVDLYNNQNYVCGAAFDNWGIRYGYIKNGKSWNKEIEDENVSLYNCDGYYKVCYIGTKEESAIPCSPVCRTAINQNEIYGYLQVGDAPKSLTGKTASGNETTRRIKGKNCMIIKLKKGEMLVPYLQERMYCEYKNIEKLKYYPIDIDLSIKVKAVAQPTTTPDKRNLFYNMESTFDNQLQLGNFFSSEQKMSEFISNIQKAFNLDFNRSGNVVTMNLNKPYEITKNIPIDIDNRINVGENIPYEGIDYPSKLSVQFNIDTEEEGFYRSVPNDKINDNDWEEYGDRGYDDIIVSDVDDAKETTQTVGFSHNWYNSFLVYQYYTRSYGGCTRVPIDVDDVSIKLDIPIIGKSEWWIEGYKYAEMAKNDGRSMKQRFWFRGEPLKIKDFVDVSNRGYMSELFVILPVSSTWKCAAEIPYYNVTLPVPTKTINGETMYLTYENKENTLLRKFFNVGWSSSNDCVNVECYISPQEYVDLCKGRNVHFNDDIYEVLNVKNYDPEKGKAKLTLMSI